MAILDTIKYIDGKINESASNTAILDNKEDGFTTSASNRTTKDVRIWKFSTAVLTEQERTEILAFDDTYKTTLPFLITRQDSGESMNCRLKTRLKVDKDFSYPEVFWLNSFEVTEVLADWE